MKNYHDGGEAIVEALRNLSVDYILSSPGSEWSPVWEAMARQKVEGASGPTFIDCWHETLAVDMAMGYTAYTGRPQAVLIHAGVGLMHGSMAVLSATQAEIPLVVMSGESTTFGEDPEIAMEPQWYGGVSVGGAHRMIQPLVKWAGQVTHASNIHQAVLRAGEMAQRTPQGPVYLNMSLEAMMQPWSKPDDLRPAAPAPRTQAPRQDIEAVAALARAASNPVIVVEISGRDPAAFHGLVALAESLGAPVISARASTFATMASSWKVLRTVSGGVHKKMSPKGTPGTRRPSGASSDMDEKAAGLRSAISAASQPPSEAPTTGTGPSLSASMASR